MCESSTLPLNLPPGIPPTLSVMSLGGKSDSPGKTSLVQSMFTQGTVMMLQSVASGTVLCIHEGEVSGKEIKNSYYHFVVHVRNPGVVSLQCADNLKQWLAICDGKVLASGGEGPYSEFELSEVENKYVVLKSVFYPDQHLGIQENGELKPPSETTAQDRASLFVPYPQLMATPTQECPPDTHTPSTTAESPALPPPYTGPPQKQIQEQRTQTQQVSLQRAQTIEFDSGRTHWNAGQQARVRQGSLPTARGIGYGYPTATGGDIGAAMVVGSLPTTAYYQPPVAYGYTQYSYYPQQGPYQQQGYMHVQPQSYQQPAVPSGPRPVSSDVQSQGYQQPAEVPRGPVSFPVSFDAQLQGNQQPTEVPSGPASPVGYVLWDLLNSVNTLTLIPSLDESGRPIHVSYNLFSGANLRNRLFGGATLKNGGSFVNKDSEFLAETVGQGVVVLENPGCGYVVASDTKTLGVLRGRYTQNYKFVVRLISGAVVAFESLKFPGHYLSAGKDGLVKLEQHSLESKNVQFTVRVSKFCGPYSQMIMSPFAVGKPSVFNSLKDRSVIELYHRPTMTFLCLKEGGGVTGVQASDMGTLLIFCDRGMGRVSLKSYHRGILKLLMTIGGKMSCVGSEDATGDFYVKENQNGTIQFESVAFPGKYVHIPQKDGNKTVQLCEFSVYQLDINQGYYQGGNRAVPRYALN